VRVIQTFTFISYLFSYFKLSSCVLILVSTLLFFAFDTFDIFRSPKVERITLVLPSIKHSQHRTICRSISQSPTLETLYLIVDKTKAINLLINRFLRKEKHFLR
jgi:hypothetical protein